MDLAPFVVAGVGIGAVYALSGVGLVLLFRTSGTLNFALGALGAVAAHVAWSLIEAGVPTTLASLIGVGVTAGLSLAYGLLFAPLLAGRDRTVRAVATLGLALVLLGVLGTFWGEQPRRLTLPTDTAALNILGVRVTMTRLFAACIVIVLVVTIEVLLEQTRAGLSMRALSVNRELATLLGIDVRRSDALAWLVSGTLAGISGLLLADLVRLQATFLTFLIIPAIAAALLGFLSSVRAAAAGGFAIGLIESLVTAWPELSAYRSATPFLMALLFVAALGRRGNLMGRGS
jgi:branched-chain amino acid transport system permease protein